MSKEAFFISQFQSSRIGDDGAVVGRTVYSKDLFCEDIHFKREWMSLEQIAHKSMLVNISDAIAMNATPKYALIGVVIPKNFSLQELKALSNGFSKIAKEYKVEVIGGDTTAGEKLMISVTIVSKLNKKPLYRHNVKKGDLVAHTGTLGNSYKGLTRLLRGGKVGKNSRFIRPTLRGNFIKKAARHLNSGMDISDGLSKDLSRLLAFGGGLGLSSFKKIDKKVACSGEEYEMLFSFDARKLGAIKRVAKQTRTKINIVGKVVRKRYKCPCKEHHF